MQAIQGILRLRFAGSCGSGACTLVNGKDGTGGCKDPLHDYEIEQQAPTVEPQKDSDLCIYCGRLEINHSAGMFCIRPALTKFTKFGECEGVADIGANKAVRVPEVSPDTDALTLQHASLRNEHSPIQPEAGSTRPEMPPSLPRIETGNVQFNNDWPGVFFRGDTAINIARQLRLATSNGKKVGFERLASLIDALEDCHVKLDHAIQHVKRAASVQQEPSLECWNCHAEIPAEDRELIACHDCHYKWRNAV